MSDFISKRELYHKLGEAYNKGYLSWGANEIFKDIIGECDSVENKGEWIPVTERLPEESGRYLTYIVNEYDEELQYIMTADYIARPTPIEGLSPWYVDDECASDNVVAWQPLPEPYKGEREDEK